MNATRDARRIRQTRRSAPRAAAFLALLALSIATGGVATAASGSPGPSGSDATPQPSPTAAASPVVVVSPTTIRQDGETEISLRGYGFQSIPKGFGGIYILFGTVKDDWRPSQGGQSGRDYSYVKDEEAKENHGYQRFVTFPGSSTAFAANGGELAPDGSWATTLIVPGPVFVAVGRDEIEREIDCRAVQCGVLTIGAHGVVNPSNETFTPITFALAASAPPSASAVAAIVTAAPTGGETSPASSVSDDPSVGWIVTGLLALCVGVFAVGRWRRGSGRF